MKRILLNSSYAITSNLLSLIVTSFVILVLPRLIGVEEYGYWQLYLFYTSYVGFAHLGWIDGIYLTYGGIDYEDLDKQRIYSQFISYLLFQIIIAALIFLFSVFFVEENEKEFIFRMLSLTLLATNVRFFIIYLLQTTNLIVESSRVTILDRLIYLSFLVGLIVLGTHNYQLLIVVDVIARFISVFYGIYLCKDVLLLNKSNFKFDFNDILQNIKIGSNLMLSNVASMLIIGTVRMGIERGWNVATFGKVSLTLSISNLIMTFINAVGIVIFPMLKKTDESRLPVLYSKIRNYLMPVLLTALLLFYPLSFILNSWLPSYADSLSFMILLFPISVFEGKMALLINPYMKAYRMEKSILFVNIISMLFSIFVTVFTAVIFHNLIYATLSITILLAFRCYLAEYMLSNKLSISITIESILELLMVGFFIFSTWFFPTISGFICNLLLMIIYNFSKYRIIKNNRLF